VPVEKETRKNVGTCLTGGFNMITWIRSSNGLGQNVGTRDGGFHNSGGDLVQPTRII
jgi:hypothetical protein